MQRSESTTSSEVVWTEASRNSTWLDIVFEALRALEEKDVPLREIYRAVETCPKVLGKRFWQARIRATLQGAPEVFLRTGPGLWSLAELYDDAAREESMRLRRERYPLLGPRERKS